MKAWDCGAASGGKSSGDCGEYRWRSAPKTFNRGISANDRVNRKFRTVQRPRRKIGRGSVVRSSAMVSRPISCVVRGWDRYGVPVEYKLSGFPARVFQHEIDHLDGVLLLDRVKHLETIGELEMWQKYWFGRDPKKVLVRGNFEFPQ